MVYPACTRLQRRLALLGGRWQATAALASLLVLLFGIGDKVKADGPFTEMPFSLQAVGSSAVAWGDVDNDGFLDILLTGFATNGPSTRLYRNLQGTNFLDYPSDILPDVFQGAVAFGDYNNDGLVDLALAGQFDQPISRI